MQTAEEILDPIFNAEDPIGSAIQAMHEYGYQAINDFKISCKRACISDGSPMDIMQNIERLDIKQFIK